MTHSERFDELRQLLRSPSGSEEICRLYADVVGREPAEHMTFAEVIMAILHREFDFATAGNNAAGIC